MTFTRHLPGQQIAKMQGAARCACGIRNRQDLALARHKGGERVPQAHLFL